MCLTSVPAHHIACSYPASRHCSPTLPHCLVALGLSLTSPVVCVLSSTAVEEELKPNHLQLTPSSPLPIRPSAHPSPLVLVLFSLGRRVILSAFQQRLLPGVGRTHLLPQHRVHLRAMEPNWETRHGKQSRNPGVNILAEFNHSQASEWTSGLDFTARGPAAAYQCWNVKSLTFWIESTGSLALGSDSIQYKG